MCVGAVLFTGQAALHFGFGRLPAPLRASGCRRCSQGSLNAPQPTPAIYPVSAHLGAMADLLALLKTALGEVVQGRVPGSDILKPLISKVR